MARDVINKQLWNSEIDTTEDSVDFPLDVGVKETLSHLLLYDENNDMSVFARADSDGNLLTSRDTQNTQTFDNSNTTIGTSASVVVNTNTDRRGLLVFNLGAATIYLGGTSSVLTTTGFPLLTNSCISFDNYLGALYGISGSAGNDVRVVEL